MTTSAAIGNQGQDPGRCSPMFALALRQIQPFAGIGPWWPKNGALANLGYEISNTALAIFSSGTQT
jgi:hypothetical protein